jgi:glycosyltransferase involved in cell wall biosynthesis
MDETRALVKAHGMQDVFHFTGFRADVPSLLGALDCFVLSSHWEGFPLALLEAMASGLPVVSTRVMGATEAVQEGVTGFLVPIGDIDALANAICKLIEEPALRLEFGKMARQRVMNEFTQSQMVDRIQDLYESVLRAKADSRNRII